MMLTIPIFLTRINIRPIRYVSQPTLYTITIGQPNNAVSTVAVPDATNAAVACRRTCLVTPVVTDRFFGFNFVEEMILLIKAVISSDGDATMKPVPGTA